MILNTLFRIFLISFSIYFLFYYLEDTLNLIDPSNINADSHVQKVNGMLNPNKVFSDHIIANGISVAYTAATMKNPNKLPRIEAIFIILILSMMFSRQ